MTTATVKARQTVYDIALEQYGTCEAVGEILALNPQIANDPEALVQLGIFRPTMASRRSPFVK